MSEIPRCVCLSLVRGRHAREAPQSVRFTGGTRTRNSNLEVFLTTDDPERLRRNRSFEPRITLMMGSKSEIRIRLRRVEIRNKFELTKGEIEPRMTRITRMGE